MNQITVNGPGGISINFPEGTDPETINRVMNEAYQNNSLAQMEVRVRDMTHEQIVNEFQTAKNGPWRDFLRDTISKPLPGETDEQRKKRIGQGPVSAVPGWASALYGFGDVANYGFMDEAFAGLDTLLGRSRDYETALKSNRQNAAEARSANPKSYLGGQIAGGVPLAAQALVAAPAAGARTLGGLALVGGTEGAVQGGLYGLGSGEDQNDRLWQGVQQALAGMVIGGAAPFAGRAMGSAYRAVKDAVSNRGPGGKAAKGIMQMLQDNGLTVEQARKALARLGDQGMLADISPGMQVEAAGTAAAAPAASDVMSPRLAQRHDGMGRRVKGLLDEAMGKFQDPQSIADQVRTTKAYTGQAYQGAEQYVVDAQPVLDEINALLGTYPKNSPIGKTLLEWRGQIQPEIGGQMDRGHLLHGFKKGIKDAEDEAFRQGKSTLGNALKSIRQRADEVLKTSIPGFAEADKTWSGAQKVQEAFDYGQREVMGGNVYPGQFSKTWSAMSAPEKEAARMGTRARLEMDTVSGAPNPGARLERQLEKNMNAQKVGPMVEDFKPGGYQKLQTGLDAETTMRETNDLVQATRGSRTTFVANAANNRWGSKSVMDGFSNALGNAATAAAAGGPAAGAASLAMQGAGAGVKGIFDFLRRTNPEVIRMAGDMLTRQGPEARGTLQQIEKLLIANGATRKQADAIARGLSTAVKSQAALGSAEIRGAIPSGGGATR